MDNITKVLFAITTVAIIATLAVNGTQAAKLVTAGGTAFSSSLGAAEKG